MVGRGGEQKRVLWENLEFKVCSGFPLTTVTPLMDELLSGRKSFFFLLDTSIVAGHGSSPSGFPTFKSWFLFVIMFTMAMQIFHHHINTFTKHHSI